jgi:hypothetical protein
MSSNSGNGFLQGLGISAGLMSAPILITVGVILAVALLCCVCCGGSVLLGALGEAISTPVPIR